jgi:hypothetical protein
MENKRVHSLLNISSWGATHQDIGVSTKFNPPLDPMHCCDALPWIPLVKGCVERVITEKREGDLLKKIQVAINFKSKQQLTYQHDLLGCLLAKKWRQVVRVRRQRDVLCV